MTRDKNIKKSNLFYFFIIAVSIIGTNNELIQSQDPLWPAILIMSSIFFIFFHRFYYKTFKVLTNGTNGPPTRGLTTSAIFTFILMIILTVFNIYYINSQYYNPYNSEKFTNFNLLTIFIIHLLGSFTILLTDSRFVKIPFSFSRGVSAVSFYILLFLVEILLFLFLIILLGGFA